MPHTKISIQTGPISRVTLSYSETHLLIHRPNSRSFLWSKVFTKSQKNAISSLEAKQSDQHHHRHDVPFHNVIQATFDKSSRTLLVAYVDKQKKKKGMEMHLIEGNVDENHADDAAQWAEAVIKSSYDGEQELYTSWNTF